MIKIFVQLILLCVFIFVLNLGIKSILKPIFKIDTFYFEKQKFNEVINNKFDVLIFGSSRSISSINPESFQPIKYQNQSLKVYNFGSNKLFFPSTYSIVNSVLNKVKYNPKIALIEIGYVEENFIIENEFWNKSILLQLFDKLSVYEFYKFLIKTLKSTMEWLSMCSFSTNYNMQSGFMSMDSMSIHFPVIFNQNKFFLQFETSRLNEFDPRKITILQKNKSVETKTFEVYLDNLTDKLNEKNIKVFYFLPNRIGDSNRDIITAGFNHLPDSLKFNPNINQEFGVLLKPEYSWDLGHVNEKGAKIYSEIFIEEFKNQIINKGHLK